MSWRKAYRASQVRLPCVACGAQTNTHGELGAAAFCAECAKKLGVSNAEKPWKAYIVVEIDGELRAYETYDKMPRCDPDLEAILVRALPVTDYGPRTACALVGHDVPNQGGRTAPVDLGETCRRCGAPHWQCVDDSYIVETRDTISVGGGRTREPTPEWLEAGTIRQRMNLLWR